MSIVITNQRVVDFYERNPSLSPEDVNLWIVEMMDKVVGGNEQGVAHGMLSKLETFFGDHAKRMDTMGKQMDVQNATRDFLQSSVQQIHNSMGTMRDDFKSLIVSQFVDSQKDNERLIRSALDGAVDDGKQKDAIVRALNDTMSEKLGVFAKEIQAPFSELVGASERRIGDTLVRIHSEGVETKTMLTKTGRDLDGYLAKYSRSKDKGNIGERKLAGIINTLYPSCELVDTTSSGGGKGDFIMRRPGKPQILFETKEFADGSKVPKKDVIKFLNDVKDNECCGILVNHTGAITEKDNYFFEFHMGKVMLYIHDANYEMDKIELAVRLIDYLDDRIREMNNISCGGNIITDDVMEQINTEFATFNESKERMMTDAREFYNNTKRNLEMMHFVGLHKFLSTKFATEKSAEYICKACEIGFKNSRALAAHRRSKTCKANDNNAENVSPMKVTTSVS